MRSPSESATHGSHNHNHDDSPTKTSEWTARIVSGAAGSLLTSLVVTPLDVVKVRMQAATDYSPPTHILKPTTASVVVPCPRGCGTFVVFNGVTDCVLSKRSVPYFDAMGQITPRAATSTNSVGTFGMIRTIFANEGWSGVYAGLRPTLVMSIPNAVMYYTAYDEIVHQLRLRLADDNNHNDNNDNDNSTLARSLPLFAGGSARFLASTITLPLEVLRTRQAAANASEQSTSRGMWHELRTVLRKDGVTALFRGWSPTMWRDVPFSAIYWFCIEEMKEFWYHRKMQCDHTTPTPGEQFGIAFSNGAIAGMIAAACTTPFDVVKTRQQTAVTEAIRNSCDHHGASVHSTMTSSNANSSTLAGLRHIAQTEGVAALWRGNQARMIKVAPACAIMISTYELGKLWLLN